MRLVIQRVKHASVTIEGTVKSKIGQGMLILVGIENADTREALVVSQFTLFASCKKGNSPSWFRAATHDISIPLYEAFCQQLSTAIGKEVGTGEFGADMKVELLNDGPVTIIIDSKNRE